MILRLMEHLALGPEPWAPRAQWRALLGDEALRGLEASGLVQRVALKDGDALPCDEGGEPNCQRRLRREGDGTLRACCSCPWQAPDVMIPTDDGWSLTLPARNLVSVIARTLGLSTVPPQIQKQPRGGLLFVGSRTFGAERVAFYLQSGDEELLEEDRPPLPERHVTVILSNRQPNKRRSRLQGEDTHLLVLGLHDVMKLDADGFAPRWSLLLRSLRPDMEQAGALLWPDVHLLIDIRRRRAWLAGQLLNLPAGGQSEVLLLALARKPSLLVSRFELIDLLWPEETARKRRHPNHNLRDNDDKLRSAVLQLRKALAPALAGADGRLPADPVNVLVPEREVDIHRSGYRLMIGGEHILIWE